MDSMCISTRNEFATFRKNLVGPKSGSPNHNARRLSSIIQVYHHPESIVEVIGELSHEPNNGVSPLREEENVDSNSNDSSNTMRVSTSLPSANAVGKCSNLHMTCCGFSKEASEKTPHVAIKPFQTPVEEKMELYSYGSSEITVFSSPQLAGPFIFNFSGLSGWTIPSSSSNSSSLWILDSGATHHVSCSQASFESFNPLFNCVGTLPNGHTVPVGGIGSVRLCNDLTLQNVLFVPQFDWNLLSISALTKQHPYVVSFDSDHYAIENPKQGRRIVMGKQSGNFYTLDLSQMFLVSYGPSEIKVPFSPQLAGPSMFHFSGLSGWTIPSSSSNSSSLWILDSGVTHHVCCSPASFESLDPRFNSVGTLPNGHTVPVGGIGSVRLCNDLTLQNVLFVPQFHCNLLSISALTEQYPFVVRFDSDHYVIENPKQGRRIGMGKQSGNFYTLDLSQMFFFSP